MQTAGSPVIAIVALSSDELEKGVESKEVAFGQLRSGVLSALPDSVRVAAPRTTVRLKVARIDAGAGIRMTAFLESPVAVGMTSLRRSQYFLQIIGSSRLHA